MGFRLGDLVLAEREPIVYLGLSLIAKEEGRRPETPWRDWVGPLKHFEALIPS